MISFKAIGALLDYPTAELQAGERSLAVRLELLDDENTLTDERIEQAVAKVVTQLGERLGARLRG